MELGGDPENLVYLLTAANVWMIKYPEDTTFWIEHGVGKRICAWLAEIMKTHPGSFAASRFPSSEIDHILDGLVKLGVPSARSVEETLYRLRTGAV